MVKPEKNSKLLESVATKLKDEDFQQSLEGLSEQEKSKKEFNKLFGAFNLRSVQLEEMWVKLLDIKIIETSDKIFNIDLYKEISNVQVKDIRNINNVVNDEQTHYDPETKKIHLLGNSKKASQYNKILRAYENRNSEANVANRKGNNLFANHNYLTCTIFD